MGVANNRSGTVTWPLHDIVITNIVWCIAYKRAVGRGVLYCPIIVQSYCTRVGNAGGRGEWKVGWLVHNNLDVNEYLVKAKPSRVNPNPLTLTLD